MHTHTQRGFTLIELLVVVLIIGILAAVALPQYQKAVEKARATQALTWLSALYQAAESYQLAQGEWPVSLDELAVDIPQLQSGGEWDATIENTNTDVKGIVITRLHGKYAGTSLRKYKSHPYDNIPKETILCGENQSNATVLFSGERGSYCQKILGGQDVYVGAAVWVSMWALP